ncbi:MAG: HprK-related kinase A [Rubrivivax sp.]
MRLAELPAGEMRRRLHDGSLCLRTGPVRLRLRSDVDAVQQGLALLYADHPLVDGDEFCDYAVDVRHRPGLRRWLRPQVQFLFDHEPVFEPLPLAQALALTEWALNWCIGSRSHQFLVLHAAVVERLGHAAVLPAPPGSGKSTLCAALVNRGWRLLSDELALISLRDGRIHALARPVSLKNQSIDIIQRFAPASTFSRRTLATSKGTVAHMKALPEHVLRMDEPARPAWVVFPRYVPDAPAELAPRAKADAMLQLSRNAFNSGIASREGFHALADLVDRSDCHDFRYSRLDDAITVFDRLAAARGS